MNTRKMISLVLAFCMLFSLALPVFAEDVVENMTNITLAEGSNALTVEDASAINIFLFEVTDEDKIGTYKVTTNNPDAVLYSYAGSAFFFFDNTANSDYDPVTNSFTFELKYVGPSALIGVKGAGSFSINIEYLGNFIEFDPATLPYEQYVPKVDPTPFTLELAEGAELKYVNVFKDQTVAVDENGYYHLGTVDGPILYANITGTAPYLNFTEAVSYGALRFTQYDEDGNFVAKYDFTDFQTEYVACSDATNGVYPLNADIEFMLKNVGEAKGWYDYENRATGAYLFETQIDEATGWLFATCYVVEPEKSATLTLNGEAVEYAVGAEITLNAEFYVEGGVAYRFNKWIGDVEAAGIDAAVANQTFAMPGESISLEAEYIAVGDLNNDGMVTAKDLNVLKRMVVIGADYDSIADINNDGLVSAGDVNLIIRYSLGTWTPNK